MTTKQHLVELTDAERQHVRELTSRGSAPARRIRRARILLLADQRRPDRAIAQAVGCCVATVTSAVTSPADGWRRGTTQLLADTLVELGCVDTVSGETVRRTLKTTTTRRGKRTTGASPS
jgi:putative transposase